MRSTLSCFHADSVFWDTHVDWAAVDPGDGLPRKPAVQSD